MDLTDDDDGHLPRPSSSPALYTLSTESSKSTNRSPKTIAPPPSHPPIRIEENEAPASDVPDSIAMEATPTFFVSACQPPDLDGGNHSSEEELEEINNIPLPLPPNSSPSSSMSTPPPATPVEFLDTPPNHVYKPRRSTSPPPLVPQEAELTIKGATPPEIEQAPPPLVSSSGGSPAPNSTTSLLHMNTTNTAEYRSQHENLLLERTRSFDRRAIASKKRYKQSRIHHIQRPCLDFEKMQLVSIFISIHTYDKRVSVTGSQYHRSTSLHKQ